MRPFPRIFTISLPKNLQANDQEADAYVNIQIEKLHNGDFNQTYAKPNDSAGGRLERVSNGKYVYHYKSDGKQPKREARPTASETES